VGPGTQKFANKWALIPVGFGLMLAASNLYLLRENQRLRNRIEFQTATRYPQVGTNLPALRGKDIDGRPITISYPGAGAGTLMLVFSETCVHCERNWPDWSRLVNESVNNRVVFVNIGPTLSTDFVQEHGLGSATVVAHADPDSIVKYALMETPVTLRISPDGRVLGAWGGELGASGASEVREALAVRAR